MARFEDFTPRERITMHDALLQMAESDDSHELESWTRAADTLCNEVGKLCGDAETKEANVMNDGG